MSKDIKKEYLDTTQAEGGQPGLDNAQPLDNSQYRKESFFGVSGAATSSEDKLLFIDATDNTQKQLLIDDLRDDIAGSETHKGTWEKITDAELPGKTDDTRVLSAKQLFDYYSVEPVAGTTYTLASADTERTNSTPTTLVKVKEIDIEYTGEYTVEFDLKRSGINNAFGRVYKNGVAFGTLQTSGSTTYATKTEDLSFDEGDTCELWLDSESSTTSFARNFRIKYDVSLRSRTFVTATVVIN